MSKLSDVQLTEENVFRAAIDAIIMNGDWESTQVRDDVVDYLLVDVMDPDDIPGNRDLVRQVEETIEKYKGDLESLMSLIFGTNRRQIDLAWLIIKEREG